MNKRCIVVLLLVAVLLLFPCSAFGANAVPSEVLNARESVVRIFSYANDMYSGGTGFAIGDSSPVEYVATNHHVIDNNPNIIKVWIDRYNYVEASKKQKQLILKKKSLKRNDRQNPHYHGYWL